MTGYTPDRRLLTRFSPPHHPRLSSRASPDYVGRANPLYFAERLTEHYGTADIYLKREDLNHTGAHKINNAVGPGASRQEDGQEGRRRDRRGSARSRPPPRARFGLECIIYMGAADMEGRSSTSSARLLGATANPCAPAPPPQGRYLRGHPDCDQRGDHPLHSRLRPGPPVPHDGRDFHAHRPGDAREAMEKWAASPTSHGVRGRRIKRRACSTSSSTMRT